MARIVVIDDDADVRDFVAKVLELDGHEVVAGRDGRDADALVSNDPIDLLILDILMPNQDGLETILGCAHLVYRHRSWRCRQEG